MISAPDVQAAANRPEETEAATFFTICNEPFFPGLVALLNSLRIIGHNDPLVVLDLGMSHSQRARLEPHAIVVDVPMTAMAHATTFKAFPSFLDPRGVVVIIDSDMIVTRSLADPIDLASKGKICVFPDHHSQAERRFEEWESAFELKGPLRQQPYVNSGFIALSTECWPDFLQRFWEVCQLVPPDARMIGESQNNPFWGADQDALNALLMSEVAPDAIELLPAAHEVYPDRLTRTRIIHSFTLECRIHGEQPAILHYSMAPKAWDRKGWVRVRRDAYVRLFPRIVCGNDARLRMEPKELPLWLRPGLIGKTTLAGLDATHGLVVSVRRMLPTRASAAVLRAKQRLTGSTHS